MSFFSSFRAYYRSLEGPIWTHFFVAILATGTTAKHITRYQAIRTVLCDGKTGTGCGAGRRCTPNVALVGGTIDCNTQISTGGIFGIPGTSCRRSCKYSQHFDSANFPTKSLFLQYQKHLFVHIGEPTHPMLEVSTVIALLDSRTNYFSIYLLKWPNCNILTAPLARETLSRLVLLHFFLQLRTVGTNNKKKISELLLIY